MSRNRRMTDAGVARLKPRATRYTHADPELPGHYIRVQPSGSKSYVAVARDPNGKQIWATIGAVGLFQIEQARERAREAIKRIQAGLPAFEPPEQTETFGDVAKLYLKRYVAAKRLRTHHEIERHLDRYILPKWRERPFVSIRRSDLAALLDDIEDKNGPRQADHCLAVVRQMGNWYAARNDDYTPPVVRGMRRTSPENRKRARVLDDDEIRAIWKQAENNGAFGAIIRLLLLTSQRRGKVASMRWEDLSVDGEWRIPAEEREKGTGGALLLPAQASVIIRKQPRLAGNPYIFAGRGKSHFNGYSKCKRAFDDKLPDIEPWRLHDLRRTARSLMSRAGVRPDIAERVLGHAIAGVEGVYDRHSYREEKADALERLAQLIETIIDPPADNDMPSLRATQ